MNLLFLVMGIRAAYGRRREKEAACTQGLLLGVWLAGQHQFLETDSGTAGKFALACIQVALVCRATPALFGPLKTHSFTLPGFTLRTCSALPLLKRTFFFFFLIIIIFLICSEFCHTLKWNVLEFTCLPHPDPPSHLPLHPLPPGHETDFLTAITG